MNNGETINQIRKMKGLTIEEVCQDVLSKSNYNRFVNDKIDISVTKFNGLLENLCVAHEEFLRIQTSYSHAAFPEIMHRMKLHFQQHSIDGLQTDLALITQQQSQNVKFTHLFALCKIMISRLDNSDSLASQRLISTYLNHVETWTHYEIVLFNNCIFIFDLPLVLTVINRLAHTLEMYSSIQNYGNETFRLYINIITVLLQNEQFAVAHQCLSTLQQIKLRQEDLLERNIRLFFDGLFLLKTDEPGGRKKIQSALNIFCQLEANDLVTMHENMLEQFTKMYL
ncbi:hypothetical protein EQG49_00715 [Periweissella cryptocerci]|uniref:HTH-type transcriptional regulator Rgg C-terminal domain-containing protein n=1 Tax=Periweissella cryptocerci TaxID=2506420 RepID=A0A4P6YR48_9LACO|nr:Rgg/GadR/MutR family transcriptional regulator [Periweissella cryptocerci]QBO35076.1 hypothetical protein EQG49_00715 [Periweissella cryptocerci]